MAGGITTLYGREGSVCVGGAYIVRSPRHRWGEGGGSVACTTEPYLRELPRVGPVQIAVETFVTARKRFGHPVTFYRWEIDDASDKANLPF